MRSDLAISANQAPAEVVSFLSKSDPRDVNRKAVSLGPAYGLLIKIKTIFTGQEGWPMSPRSIEVIDAGADPDTFDARKQELAGRIAKLMAPASQASLSEALIRLDVETKQRGETDARGSARAAAYIARLSEFPADVALSVLRWWPTQAHERGRWWPTINELTEECRRRTAERSMLLSALSRPAEGDRKRPSGDERERVATGLSGLLKRMRGEASEVAL